MADNLLKIITRLHMNDKLQRIFGQALNTLGPFILLGIVIACVIGLFILSYYVFLWGMIIGCILWVFNLIKRSLSTNNTTEKKTEGRIIDHDKNQ